MHFLSLFKKCCNIFPLSLLMFFLLIFGISNWQRVDATNKGKEVDKTHKEEKNVDPAKTRLKFEFFPKKKDNKKHNILYIMKNGSPSHYEFNKKLALTLHPESAVGKIVILVVDSSGKAVKDAEGKKKFIRELTEEEHIQYEDAELATHIDDRLEVLYFYGDKLKKATKHKTLSRSPSISSGIGSSSKKGETPLSRTNSVGSSKKGETPRGRPNSPGIGSSSKKGETPRARSSSSSIKRGRSKSPQAIEKSSKKLSRSSSSSTASDGSKKEKLVFPWEERDFEKIESICGSDGNTFFPLTNNKNHMKKLELEHFDIGIAEVWDWYAFYIFEMLGIPTTVATSAMPSQAQFYAWMDNYEQKLIKANIPELWSAPKKDNLATRYKTNIQKAKNDYDLADAYYCSKMKDIAKEKREIKRGEDMNAVEKTITEFGDKCVIMIENYKKKKKEEKETERRKKEKPRVVEHTIFEKLFKKSKIYFVNTQPIVDFPLPNPPKKMTFIGGIATKTEKQLNEDEVKIIAKAKKTKGLIYFSLGSQFRTAQIPRNVRASFLQFIKNHPEYEFIWKLDQLNEIKEKERPKNLHIMTWVNQPALLAQEETVLFISHCGMNSVLEAAQMGVALLCMPLSADQFYNAEAAHWNKLAEILDKTLIVKGPVHDGVKYITDKMLIALGHAKTIDDVKEKFAHIHPEKVFLARMHELFAGHL